MGGEARLAPTPHHARSAIAISDVHRHVSLHIHLIICVGVQIFCDVMVSRHGAAVRCGVA